MIGRSGQTGRRRGPAALAWSVAALLLACGSSARAEAPFAALVEQYLEVHSALADDRLQGVAAAAALMQKQAAAIGPSAARMGDAARALAAAADLPAARQAFASLSDAVIAYSDAAGVKPGAGISVAYCPMAKKSWLQRGATIRNPYYGRAMGTCGELKTRAASPAS